MAAPVSIRRAVAADAAALHAMVTAIAAATGDAGKVTSRPEDFLRLGFGDRPAFEALIAEHDGRPVGLSLFFTSFSSWRGATGLYVQDLYVDPAMRGGGLGRRLLAATAAIARARGGRYLRLSADAGNAAAHAVYGRTGFAHAAAERIFVLAGEAFAALGEEGETIDGDR